MDLSWTFLLAFVLVLLTVIALKINTFIDTFKSICRGNSTKESMKRRANNYNKAMHDQKVSLFSKIASPAGQKQQLDILEIGVGTGANFKYYPDNCNLICTDSNSQCEKYLADVKHNYPHLTQVKFMHQKVGDDITGCVAAESVDVVVSTQVLCGARDVAKAITAIRRVLRPGGKFIYMEHVLAEPFTLLWISQHVSEIFWRFACHCSLLSSTGVAIQNAPFSSVKQTYFYADLRQPLVRPHIMGVAIK